MRSSREFALLTLLTGSADQFDLERDAVDALLERQLNGLEKLAARQRRLRSGQPEHAASTRPARKLS